MFFLILFFVGFSCESRIFGQVWTSTKVVGSFVCWGNFDLNEVESQLAGLGEVHQQMNEKLKLPPVQEWIEVYIFESDASWRQFLREKHPGVPYRRAMFIKKKEDRGQIFLCNTTKFACDLRHEGTHALLDAAISGVPEWLHEGLAEYFEVEPESRLTGAEWFEATQWNAKFGISRKISSLEKIHSGMSMTNKDYRDAWGWVNFLLNGPPEGREILTEMLADYASGKPSLSAEKRMKTKFKNPDSALREFYRGLKKTE